MGKTMKTRSNSILAGAASRGRGNLMLIVMVAMFVIMSATATVLTVATNALHLNSAQQLRAIAFNAAESGADYAYQKLRDLTTSPTTLTAWDPFGGTQVLDTADHSTYRVTIYPDPNNATQYRKIFRIVSIGAVGDKTQKIELVVQQASFGRYAYFTDKETSSITGGAIWWKAGESVDGPVHSNNASGSNFNINYNGSSAPIFLDMVTAHGNSMNYNPSNPSNEATYGKIFKDGSKGFRLGVPAIQLPTSTDIQKNAAWGGTTSFPGTNGVYLKANSQGGIYIRGDAAVTFSLNASGNQKIVIVQGSNTTTITLNRSAHSTSVSGPVGSGSNSSSANLPNGVIYCTGNITSLKGEIADNLYSGGQVTTRSAFTVATDVNNDKNITITGNLIYHTRPDKTQSDTATCNLAAGTLGLVAHNTVISTSTPTNVELDAVMLSGGENTDDGSFYAQNHDSRSVGTLNVLGGIIQKAREPVGTFNASTGQTTNGFSKDYHYDPRLAVNPPPFYPTTGQYEKLSWQILTN